MALTDELAVMPNGTLAALASDSRHPPGARKLEEHLLRIYDLANGTMVNEFPVLWDWGGQRIAFSRDGDLVYVGCYSVYGLAAYSVKSGIEMWRRRDLRQVQTISVSLTDDSVFCGRETGTSPMVDGLTGDRDRPMRGIREIWFSELSDDALVQTGKAKDLEIHHPIGTRVGKIPRTSFGVLQTAFSATTTLVLDPDRLVRAVDLHDFTEMWRRPKTAELECRQLGYNRKEESFVACYRRGAEQFQLIGIDQTDGSLIIRGDVPTDGKFFKSGELFVDRKGATYSVDSGRKLSDNAF